MFLSHISDLQPNSWRVYPQLNNWALTNINDNLELVSNVCLHQGSRLKGDIGTGNRSCPYHGWKYTIEGNPVNSGNTQGCRNSVPLAKQSTYTTSNFVFSAPVSLPELDFINTENLQLVENRIDTVNAHWQHIINLFLDVDHIPVVHPGVYQEISAPNINDIEWHYKENASIQLVPRIEVENAFNDTLLESDKTEKYSAAWTTVYPYTMIEWQPGAWFITVCIPVNESQTKVNVYKYRDTRYSDLNWEINERVWETAWKQDRDQAEMLTTINISAGNLEEQKHHFYNWLERNK